MKWSLAIGAIGYFSIVPALVAHGESKAPNILLISLDTTRSDHLTPYGYARDTSPFLKELAEGGAVFEQAYAPTSTTGPTHASVFSGLYPITHGVVKNGLMFVTDTPTLAEQLGQQGYQTAAVLSSFVLDRRFGYQSGFEDYRDIIPLKQSAIKMKDYLGHRVQNGFDRRANFTTDEAIAWFSEARDPDRPFFLFAHYFEPHDPYVPPQEYRKKLVGPLRDPLEYQIQLYDASIAFMDAELKRLFAFMGQRGLLENTLVVVFGDHGEGLTEHGDMHHGKDVFEESVRVPLIVAWEGVIQEGQRMSEPVSVMDLYTSLIHVGDTKYAADEQPSRNLWPSLLHSEPLPRDRPIFLYRRHYSPASAKARLRGEHFAVVREGWKFVSGPSEGLRALYNIRQDPDEMQNIIVQHRDKAAQLEALVKGWLERHMRRDTDVSGLSEEDLEALRSLGYTE